MKLLFSYFLLLSSLSTFAGLDYGKLCSTHGECQDEFGVNQGMRCFKMKTGMDSSGNFTCAIRCYALSLGSFCKRNDGEVIGKCVEESYEQPSFDPNSPNCSDAIDPIK